ncbi:sulfatase-like hydrolase/transferase [Seonamhaeicola sp.]|uniref:sulfatase-like hydrolase/transferase n=1 Tax=Seonamhaeicola sp. TaxID=1912245 RepID=UPI00261038B5|nr:sulfatase-like hydrolase/transferase [Seonamhaeicola sp.]
MRPFFLCLYFFACLVACSSNAEDLNDDNNTPLEETPTPTPIQTRPNILLVIADDMGLDACPGYTIGTTKPNMPNLQNLINNGIRFNNVWSNPTCTPTRAGILTGKYGFRTGVTKVDDPLSTSETSIQKFLDDHTGRTYNHAVIGKWHLSRNASHPNTMGVNYFAGITGGGIPSYTSWTLNTNGTTSASSEYVTTKLTNLAIDWIGNQTQPWFLWLSYNAPHTPFHLPPNNLHSQGVLPTDQASIDANPLPYYLAAIEAMDTELGRLISTWSPEEKENTIIIFIGDNGTPNQVVQVHDSRRAKGSVYQGGINVPMVIAGKGVNRMNAVEDALINTTDIFATVADIAETGTTEINDSKSFKPLFSDANAVKRDYVYTEVGNTDGTSDVTIRNATHKYMLFGDGSEALYGLSDNPLETPNLLHPNQLPLSTSNSDMKDALVSKLNALLN